MTTAVQEKPVGATEGLPVQQRRPSLVAKFAAKYNIDPDKLLPILKATAFKQRPGQPEVTNEQMAALLIVADQYGLNPFTREIFAFPDKQNGIVPVVSVDGWSRILNEDYMLNGIEFRYSESIVEPGKLDGLRLKGHEWIESVLHRKDRANPIAVREYLEEVYRPPFNGRDGPWQSHTKRMHRHKALIQGARLAFGFAGLFDEDEAHRVIEGTVLPTDPLPIEHKRGAAALNAALGVGDAPAEKVVDAEATTKEKPAGTVEQRERITASYDRCGDTEALDLVADEARDFAWTDPDQKVLDEAFKNRRAELGG